MPPGRLPGEVFRACPTGKRPRGRPRTRWRDYVSRLAWERLGVPLEELEEVSGERELNYEDNNRSVGLRPPPCVLSKWTQGGRFTYLALPRMTLVNTARFPESPGQSLWLRYRYLVLSVAHDHPWSGHLGITKTYQRVIPPAPLHPIPVMGELFEK
ncbi:hypothetical protein QTP86_005611, partial [Hemibagrus guttatus]